MRVGPLPSALPPDPALVVVDNANATAYFSQAVNPRIVEAVVFVVRDANGNVIQTITKRVVGNTTKVGIRVANLPKGAKVSAYTINRHGVSAHAPSGANVVHGDTRASRRPLPNGSCAAPGSAATSSSRRPRRRSPRRGATSSIASWPWPARRAASCT